MEKVIGIDLGTTNSVVAVVEGGEPIVIPNPEGERITPSVVAFRENGEVLVGSPAKRQAITNPENTVFSVKRFMGMKYDESKRLGDVDRVPYRVVPGRDGRVEIEIPATGKRYTPEQISAFILMHLKKAAENFLGSEVKRAVITVPAYFNDPQRQATKDAGLIAGFEEVIRVLPEPTAAALAYGLNKTDQNLKIAVYDFGGGTFDISILTLVEGAFIVKATHGDTHLGGDDIDQRIIEWLLEEFRKETGIDLSSDPAAMQRLKEAAEKAKKELSFQQETLISLPYIAFDPESRRGLNLERTLTRARLEAMAKPLIDRTVELMRKALDEAGFSRNEIDAVILVGGQTRMPLIQRTVEEFFGKNERKIASQNRLLGRFDLTGIPPAPRGVPQIEVTFEMDANGILHVTAVEKSTGKKADIRISARTGLTEEEIQRMIEEAEKFREEDERRARLAQLRNEIDARKELEEKMKSLRTVMTSDDEDRMRREYEEFQNLWNRIVSRIYQAEGGKPGGGHGGAGPEGGEGPEIEA